METLLDDVSIKVLVTLLAQPIIVAISGLIKMAAQRLARTSDSNAEGATTVHDTGRVLVWSDVAYAVVYTAAMVGCVVLGVAVADRLFHITNEAQWTLASSLVAWGVYLVMSAVGGFLAQGLLSAGKQMDRVTLERGPMVRRQQVYMISLWAKLAFLLVFIGWAALAAPGMVFRPMFFGLLTFLIIDSLSAIGLLLVD